MDTPTIGMVANVIATTQSVNPAVIDNPVTAHDSNSSTFIPVASLIILLIGLNSKRIQKTETTANNIDEYFTHGFVLVFFFIYGIF